jgi:hypothetical protein
MKFTTANVVNAVKVSFFLISLLIVSGNATLQFYGILSLVTWSIFLWVLSITVLTPDILRRNDQEMGRTFRVIPMLPPMGMPPPMGMASITPTVLIVEIRNRSNQTVQRPVQEGKVNWKEEGF